MSGKITGADYLLLLFYLKGKSSEKAEPIEGRTRITKMMFIFNKEIFKKLKLNEFSFEEDLPSFEAYHYGPFSSDVHEQLDLFTNIELLKEEARNFGKVNEWDYDNELKSLEDMEDNIQEDNNDLLEDNGMTVSVYSLTPMGIEYVENEIIPQLPNRENLIPFLEQFKKQINTTDLNSLLSYVYNKYPEYASKSKIKGKVK
ncbi:hypothetical protein HF072_18300 [Bacillus sp. RO3]|nr:hypothetical protein [Bacillus sp. RO3]